MRTYVISAMLLALAGLAIPFASLGLITYYWISFMSLPNLMWGAPAIRFALIAALATVIGYLLCTPDRRIFWSFAFTACVALGIWMCITTLFALAPGSSVEHLVDYCKIVLMMIISAGIIKMRVTIHALCWIICISVGYYAIRHGCGVIVGEETFIARTGQSSPIIGDTNQLARAFVFIMPILLYLYSQCPWRSVKTAIILVFALSVLGMMGTNSRGGFVSFAAVLLYLWWQTRRKLLMILLCGFAISLSAPVISDSRWDLWSSRMDSIKSYEEDPSFQGRVAQWRYAIELANARPTGGGFSSDLLAMGYDGAAREPRGYHSNYFQMLGDHGWLGLVLYLIVLVSTWRLSGTILSLTRNCQELSWANILAAMIRASMVGYMVGGLVIAHAYYEPFYVLVAMLTVLKGMVHQQLSVEELQQSRESPLDARPFDRRRSHGAQRPIAPMVGKES